MKRFVPLAFAAFTASSAVIAAPSSILFVGNSYTFGTLKAWMGATHFLTRTLPRVRTEMSLHVLAYHLKRMLQTFGTQMLVAFIKA